MCNEKSCIPKRVINDKRVNCKFAPPKKRKKESITRDQKKERIERNETVPDGRQILVFNETC